MTVRLTELEFQNDVELSSCLSINVAFMNEIKDDHVELRHCLSGLDSVLIGPIGQEFAIDQSRQLVDRFHQLRDALETYFALEEFYGYFQSASQTNSQVATKSLQLFREHELLYLHACRLVEYAERVLYGEVKLEGSIEFIRVAYRDFYRRFHEHEQTEAELMMRFCNEEIGVGD